jgi:hypothetical protein
MKAFLAACIATCLIAVVANYGLSNAGFSASEQGTSTSVRLNP